MLRVYQGHRARAMGSFPRGFGEGAFLVLRSILLISVLSAIVGLVAEWNEGPGSINGLGPWMALGGILVSIVSGAFLASRRSERRYIR